MTEPLITSRVFDACRQWKTRLQAETWPTDVNGQTPQVTLTTSGEPAQNGELVEIVTDVGDDATIRWERMPSGRFETIPLVVVITVDTGLTKDATLDRLEVLANIVQRSVFDDTEAVPGDRSKPLSATYGQDVEGVEQVAFQMVSQNNGVRGVATVRYQSAWRI